MRLLPFIQLLTCSILPRPFISRFSCSVFCRRIFFDRIHHRYFLPNSDFHTFVDISSVANQIYSTVIWDVVDINAIRIVDVNVVVGGIRIDIVGIYDVQPRGNGSSSKTSAVRVESFLFAAHKCAASGTQSSSSVMRLRREAFLLLNLNVYPTADWPALFSMSI